MEKTSDLWKECRETVRAIQKNLKKLTSARANHEFLVFCVFLCISICFWFLQVFKENANASMEYEFRLVNVPKNIIITSQIPHSVSANVSGRGFAILEYIADMQKRSLEVDFSQFTCSDGLATLSSTTLKRIISKTLSSGVRLASTNPQSIDLFYSQGERKRVPVEFKGKLTAGSQYLVCGVFCQPDSVDVYAPLDKLDSIETAYTVATAYSNLEDTSVVSMPLQTQKGVKFVPDSVQVTICVDLFSEKTLTLPIYCENIPQNKLLRTFPLNAKVTFHVSATRFNSISENDFSLVVDYNTIKSGAKKCKLIMRDKPSDITHLRISPEYVEYVVEQVDE